MKKEIRQNLKDSIVRTILKRQTDDRIVRQWATIIKVGRYLKYVSDKIYGAKRDREISQ